ncbi:THAP domain-containing protein 1-like [Eurosta solidaginis]|uniref:THAP domain-containing protein 1-like n=1 Tax=Eurosta solidaginis TaxID=178769 RepID=UPI00353077AF
MRCAVFGCNNNNRNENKWRFFHFPKDAVVAKKWLHFCRRKDVVNLKTACICEFHFTPEDFERNIQYEMGFSSRNPTKLLPSAFPTKYSTNAEETNQRQKRVESRSRKQLVEKLLIDSAGPMDISQTEDIAEAQIIKAPIVDEKDAKIQQLEKEVKKLKKKVVSYKNNFAKQVAEVMRLRICIKKSEFHRNNLEGKLLRIFTKGQVEKMKTGNKTKNWQEEDIAKSATLYSAIPRAYKLLRKKNFPLPAVRTLQWWSQKNRMEYKH